MSGLIWAGIGKGLADAGTTFGNAMFKGIEAERQDEREALREERLLAREETRADRKIKDEETKQLKDAEIYAQAEQNAPAIGDQRRFDKFKRDVGETAMSDEDLRKVFDEQYNQQRVGNFEGADRYVERFSKQKEDVLNEIRRLGGSSTAIKEGRASYTATVEAESRADKEAADRRREDFRDRQLAQLAQYQTGMVGAAIQRAGAAETAANRPRGGDSDHTERDITAAENALAGARAKVEKGFRAPTMQEKYDAALMEAYTRKKNEYVENDPDVKRQRDRVERLNSGGSATKPGDNRAGESKPSSSVTIPDKAAAALKADPRLASQFDAKYGAGAAKQILNR